MRLEEGIEECTELLPCPFCGGEAYLINLGFRDGYDVKCSCKARMNDFGNREKAIKAWNIRINDEPKNTT